MRVRGRLQSLGQSNYRREALLFCAVKSKTDKTERTRDTTDWIAWIRRKQGRDKMVENLPNWQAGALEALQLLTSAISFQTFS